MKNFWQRIPKWVRITVPVMLVLFVVAFFVVGWYFSSKFIAVKLQKVEYDQTVQSVSGDDYTISGSAYDVDGLMGGIRSDGSMIGVYKAPFDKIIDTKTSTRALPELSGPQPKANEKISLQGNIWTTDPRAALGLEFETVKYKGPLGQMDAWFIPSPGSDKWVIMTHGIGAPKREMLRFIKPMLVADHNVLIIEYRNDVSSPPSPDGYFHLGDTEWQDLEAAVRYAKSQGAGEINLFGVSMGGSITENYLRRSSDDTSKVIHKVVLDSPALNWEEVLRFQAKKAGYPSFVYFPATVVANLRGGINMDRVTTKPEHIKHKTLLIHNADDPTIPQISSKELAEARKDLVSFVDFGSGGHVRAWNHDPARYEQLVTDFLSSP